MSPNLFDVTLQQVQKGREIFSNVCGLLRISELYIDFGYSRIFVKTCKLEDYRDNNTLLALIGWPHHCERFCQVSSRNYINWLFSVTVLLNVLYYDQKNQGLDILTTRSNNIFNDHIVCLFVCFIEVQNNQIYRSLKEKNYCPQMWVTHLMIIFCCLKFGQVKTQLFIVQLHWPRMENLLLLKVQPINYSSCCPQILIF